MRAVYHTALIFLFPLLLSRHSILLPVTSMPPTRRGSTAPDGCQISAKFPDNQSVRSRKHIHSHFHLKIAIFSTVLVLGNRSMCLFLLYNAAAQISQSSQEFALREYVRKPAISHRLNSAAASCTGMNLYPGSHTGTATRLF